MTASCGQAVAHLRSPCADCRWRQPNYECAPRCSRRLAYLEGQNRDTRFDLELNVPRATVTQAVVQPFPEKTVPICIEHGVEKKISNSGFYCPQCRREASVCPVHQMNKAADALGRLRCEKCRVEAAGRRGQWERQKLSVNPEPKKTTLPDVGQPGVEMKTGKKLDVARCPDHPEMPQILDHQGSPTGACTLCLKTARPASAGAGMPGLRVIPPGPAAPICGKHQELKQPGKDGKLRCGSCSANAGRKGGKLSSRAAPGAKAGKELPKKSQEFLLTLDFTQHPDLWRQLQEQAGKLIRSPEEQALFYIQTGLAAGEEDQPQASALEITKKNEKYSSKYSSLPQAKTLPAWLKDATPAVIRSYENGKLKTENGL